MNTCTGSTMANVLKWGHTESRTQGRIDTRPGSGAFGVGGGALKPPASSGVPSIVSDPVPRSGVIARKGDVRTHQPYAMAHVMSAVLIVISPNLMA